MAKPKKFTMVVSGDDVSPSTVRLSDLLSLLSGLQSALMATAGGKPEQHRISLVDVEKSSLKLIFETDTALALAAKRVSTAIETRAGSNLPQPAVVSVRALQRRISTRKWSLTIYNSDFKATIQPDIPVFSDPLVKGATTLFATVEKVGGKRPTASLLLPDSRHITAEVASKSIAQSLAPSLYENVELHGDAWWYSSSMELSRFRINAIGEFDRKASDPAKAFADLRERFGGVWDDIDPDKFVRNQREDSSE